MKAIKFISVNLIILGLCGCAFTAEQQAAQQARQQKAAQALQVKLAYQCDAQTAELMKEQFNPSLTQSNEEKKAFEQRYAEKVNNPMFQVCYKLALENYKAQEELEYMRQRYYLGDVWGWHRCYTCW